MVSMISKSRTGSFRCSLRLEVEQLAAIEGRGLEAGGFGNAGETAGGRKRQVIDGDDAVSNLYHNGFALDSDGGLDFRLCYDRPITPILPGN